MTVRSLAHYRKTLVAAANVLAELVALGVLHGSALSVATAVLSILTAVGVYRVGNAPKQA